MIQNTNHKNFFARYRKWIVGGGALLIIALIAALVLVDLFVLRGNVKVIGLNLSNEQIVSGEPVRATITVENMGRQSATYKAVLTVDGKLQTLDGLEVKHTGPQAITFDLSALQPGQHTIQIGSYSRQLKILRPASLAVTGLILDADKIMVGGTITAQAVIHNAGDVEGTFASRFTYDGAAMDTPAVTVKPAEDETVEVKLSAQANGTHEIALGSQKQTFTALNPAKIAVVGLTLSKQYAGLNESVPFTVTVENTGDVAGTCRVPFSVNGKLEDSQTVSIGANTKLVSTFVLVESNPGKYVLKTGKFAKTLSVFATIRPASGTLLVNKANGGAGKLTLVNGSKNQDAVFVLVSTTDPKTPLLTVYVRAGGKASRIKIADGKYDIFYTTGTDYNPATKRFLNASSIKRITTAYLFETTGSGRRKHASTWLVALNETGESPTAVTAPDADFPD